MLMQLNAWSGLLLCAGTFKIPSFAPSASPSLSDHGDAQLSGHVLWRTI